MHAVVEALKARGFPDAKIKIERFATSIPQARARRAGDARRPDMPNAR